MRYIYTVKKRMPVLPMKMATICNSAHSVADLQCSVTVHCSQDKARTKCSAWSGCVPMRRKRKPISVLHRGNFYINRSQWRARQVLFPTPTEILSHYKIEPKTWSFYDQLVREAGVSRHHGVQLRALTPLEHHSTMVPWGLRGGSLIQPPLCREASACRTGGNRLITK